MAKNGDGMSGNACHGSAPIRAAAAATRDLVCALCAPATSRGLDAVSCRLLLQLWQEDGPTVAELAERAGLDRCEAAERVGALERTGHLRRSHRGRRANVWLTPQGREAAAALIASACPERFASLRTEIASLRDLLRRTVADVERRVDRAA